MLRLIQHFRDKAVGKVPSGSKRSSKWPKVRKAFIEKNGACAVCGGKKHLEIHHKSPFHKHPELELDPSNLIALCEGGINCHLAFGHLGNYRSFNQDVEQDAVVWKDKIAKRPK
jgi:5-methylcytosine-specific restriction protein A